jgi:glycosyltransferase involved in cell wall biosynthesis
MIYLYCNSDDGNKKIFIEHFKRAIPNLECISYSDHTLEDKKEIFTKEQFLIYDFGIQIPEWVCCNRVCVCHETAIGKHIALHGIEDYSVIPFPDKELDYTCDDYVVASSNLLRNELIVYYGIDENKIIVIDYGIDVDEELYVSDHLIDETVTLGKCPTIGIFNLFSGCDDLISSLQKMLPDIRFVILEQLNDLSRVDLYLHLPTYQGADYHVLYAIVTGIPVITTDVGIFGYPTIKIPRLVTTIHSDYKISDVRDTIDNLNSNLAKLKLNDIKEYFQFVEDNYSFEGFKEEWSMCIESLIREKDFSLYMEWFREP